MAERGLFGNRDQRGARGRDPYQAPQQGGYPQQGYAPQGGYVAQGGYAPQQGGYAPQGGYVPPTAGYQAGGYQPSAASNVTIRHPRTYQDVQNLIDRLKMREQVIVDFSTLNQQSVYRILDFLSGAIYALGGSVQQLRDNMFLFVPAGVAINVPPQFARR